MKRAALVLVACLICVTLVWAVTLYRPQNPDLAYGSTPWLGDSGETSNLWALIDETTPDHNDYVECDKDSNFDDYDVDMPTVTDPGQDTGFYLTIWAHKDTGGNDREIRCEVCEGTSPTCGVRCVMQTGNLTDTWTEYSTECGSGSIAGITDWSDLYFRCDCAGDTGGSPSGRREGHLSWMAFEVPDAPAGRTRRIF